MGVGMSIFNYWQKPKATKLEATIILLKIPTWLSYGNAFKIFRHKVKFQSEESFQKRWKNWKVTDLLIGSFHLSVGTDSCDSCSPEQM